MNLKPLYERIVIEIDDKQEVVSSSGLTYMKDMSLSSNTIMKGIVKAVGEGKLLQDGTIIPLKVKVGDTVIFSKMQGESYDDGVASYTILSESNILAIVKKEDTDENN